MGTPATSNVVALRTKPRALNADVRLVCVTVSGIQFHFTDQMVYRIVTKGSVEKWAFPAAASTMLDVLLKQASGRFTSGAGLIRVESITQALIDNPNAAMTDYYSTGEVTLPIVESWLRRQVVRVGHALRKHFPRFNYFRSRRIYMGKIRPGNVHRYTQEAPDGDEE